MDIKEKVKQLPKSPGVYRFLNENNQVIYVGKSNNLRSRVGSYFTGVKEGKIERLVHQIKNLEYELCDTHLEARLLECQRIKELRPIFNKQLKRERGLVYLGIGEAINQPPVFISKEPSKGIGPFRSRRLLESIIESFERLYPMQLEKNKTNVDFKYHVLPRRPSEESYVENQRALHQLITEEPIWLTFLEDLADAMMKAADEERFQEAIFYRDFIENLNQFQRRWFDDVGIFDQIIFLKIPMESGVKFFRVKRGLIEKHMVSTDESDLEFSNFMNTPVKEVLNPWESFSKLEQYDFWDIVYSEIRSLPKEQVVRCNKRTAIDL